MISWSCRKIDGVIEATII